MQVILEKVVLDMQFANENTYLWFFREIANKQSRIDELRYGILYPRNAGTAASIQRLEKEESELIEKAGKILPVDLYERLGLLTKNARAA